MTWPAVLALVLALGWLAGCGTVAPPPPRASESPRARCLANPEETGTRPLFFFFCVEAP